jgi:hypothetical protein
MSETGFSGLPGPSEGDQRFDLVASPGGFDNNGFNASDFDRNQTLRQIFGLAQTTADEPEGLVDYAAYDPDNKLFDVEDEGVCLPGDQRLDDSDDCQAALQDENQLLDRQFADKLLADWLEGAQTADHTSGRSH